MLKFSKTLKSKLHSYVNKFRVHIFSTNEKVLLCFVKRQLIKKKCFINQHLSTMKYISALALKSDKKKIMLLSTAISTYYRKSQIALDLRKALIDDGINSWKVENVSFKTF